MLSGRGLESGEICGLGFVSITPDSFHTCSFSGQNMSCSAPSFPAGNVEEILVMVSVGSTGTHTITGSTSHADFDPDGTNNNDSIVIEASAALGSISGIVYEDNNGNGQLDQGELPEQGIPVTLSGAASAAATTNASGAYSFADLEAGDYAVAVGTKPDPQGLEQAWAPLRLVHLAPRAIRASSA